LICRRQTSLTAPPSTPAAGRPMQKLTGLRFNRLLLTGAAGTVGRMLRPRMKRYCETLRVSDLAAMDPAGDGEEVVVAPLEDETIKAYIMPRPDTYYGLSKAFGENLAQFYFDRHGLETVSIRIGSCLPEPQDRRHLSSWLGYDDSERLLVAALTAPIVGHSII